MLSAICFSLDQSKILSSGNGLKVSVEKASRLDDSDVLELITPDIAVEGEVMGHEGSRVSPNIRR